VTRPGQCWQVQRNLSGHVNSFFFPCEKDSTRTKLKTTIYLSTTTSFAGTLPMDARESE
jgi:hypothetical protein